MPYLSDAFASSWRLLRGATSAFFHYQGVTQAAALSFYAILAFIPLVFLALAVAGLVLGDTQAVRELFDRYKNMVMPELHDELYNHALRLVETSAGLGWMSLGFILWTSGLFFAALQSSLLLPWAREHEHTKGVVRLFLPWILGPAFGALLPAAMLAMHVVGYLPWHWLPFHIVHKVGIWFLLGALIFLLYVVLLPRNFPLLATASLALAIAGGSQLLTLLFVRIFATLPNYALVYGSLAGLALFMLWLEYNMALILWGGHWVRLWKEQRSAS